MAAITDQSHLYFFLLRWLKMVLSASRICNNKTYFFFFKADL